MIRFLQRTGDVRAGAAVAAALAFVVPLAALAALAADPVSADAEPLDGIVAVVDEEIILTSEVEEELYLASMRGQLALTDSVAVAGYRAEILEALIEGKVILVKARAEGIRPTSDEVDTSVARMIDDIRSRFPDAATFELQLAQEGSSVEQLEEDYRPKVEEQLIVRQFVDRAVRSRVSVDEREVRAYWEKNRGEIPMVPAGLGLSRILLSFSASAGSDTASSRRAEIVRDRLEAGEDFATLATVFSEGPAASRGGDLGWFRIVDLDPALAEALEGLSAGDVTPVVHSARGAHIMRVEKVAANGAEMKVSQIVFLRDEESDRASARARAESVRLRLESGEDFAAVATAESDDEATAPLGGQLGTIALADLDPVYQRGLESLQPGEISEPLEDDIGLSIFRVDGREGAREPTYEEVRDRVASLLEQEKAAEMYREFLETAREDVYIENRLLTDG